MMHNVDCTLFTEQCNLFKYKMLYMLHCTIQTLNYIMYTIDCTLYTVSILEWEEMYMIKYNPLSEGVPADEAQGNS